MLLSFFFSNEVSCLLWDSPVSTKLLWQAICRSSKSDGANENILNASHSCNPACQKSRHTSHRFKDESVSQCFLVVLSTKGQASCQIRRQKRRHNFFHAGPDVRCAPTAQMWSLQCKKMKTIKSQCDKNIQSVKHRVWWASGHTGGKVECTHICACSTWYTSLINCVLATLSQRAYNLTPFFTTIRSAVSVISKMQKRNHKTAFQCHCFMDPRAELYNMIEICGKT